MTPKCGQCVVRIIDGQKFLAVQPDCPRHSGITEREESVERVPSYSIMANAVSKLPMIPYTAEVRIGYFKMNLSGGSYDPTVLGESDA